ncbi:N-acetylmuramoyl-L-alanine amidase [Georgenia muralis]|uniref:N-acetylmuramoyl-L-alanine amidase n=1 Tax=Georgenia muralis TaxID=154117 RepID=A0A3N4YZV0_9MICO|nr:N-acetylmuramoyl-L-alanine amidase [Georgenia muralis]RPF25913.1 N-acetylmuramoyl-L-alanine amidase [Georgenia muralis]
MADRRSPALFLVALLAGGFLTALPAGAVVGAQAPAAAGPDTAGPGLPAAGAVPAEGDTPEPITVISLTDAAGELTPVAVEGVEQLDAGVATDGEASVGTVGLRVPGGGPRGVAAALPVVLPADTAVDPADIAVLTPPMDTEEFLVAGVTWEAGSALPSGARVFLRVLEDGVWSDWLETQVEEGAVQTGSSAEGRAGTDPFITGGADAIQVQVSGDAAALPAGLELSLMPANPAPPIEVITQAPAEPEVLPSEEPTATTEPAAFRSLGSTVVTTASSPARAVSDGAASVTATGDALVTPAALAVDPVATSTAVVAAGVAPTAVARPAIVSRAGWDANESLMTWQPKYSELKAAVVHHTAGTNTYTSGQSASIVRGIYYYHAVTRDWGDIGYNFLVDKYGQVFEGRRGSLGAADGQVPQGAHAAPFNTSTLGIAAMGDYTKVDAPQIVMDTMRDVIAWKFSRSSIDMSTPSGLISPGTYALPAGKKLPRVFGHRDVSSTTCPGDNIYGRIADMAGEVAARMPQMFYLNNAFDTTADTVFGYGENDAEVLVGDWDGEGTDTVATRQGTVFRINNRNAFSDPDVTLVYGERGDEVLAGDWDGDGKDTFAVRRENIYYIRNTTSSGPAHLVIAYGRPDDEVVVGDWDGDGRDSLAVRRGHTYLVKNSMSTGTADYSVMYGRPDDEVLAGDWDGDGRDTFAVRRGAQYFIKNTIAIGDADVVVIYGRGDDAVLSGDWDRDGRDSLGVRRP